jgi:hypothetical protein
MAERSEITVNGAIHAEADGRAFAVCADQRLAPQRPAFRLRPAVILLGAADRGGARLRHAGRAVGRRAIDARRFAQWYAQQHGLDRPDLIPYSKR